MRRNLPPDTRLSPDDPNMPVLRRYKMQDGSIKTEVDPNYEQRYREMLIQTAPHPDWRTDPTYNLRRKK